MKIYSFFMFTVYLPALVLSVYAVPIEDDPNFPTPAILKDNVAFWIKIYTEVSMSEGLLHDREHPLVIFEKISSKSHPRTIRRRKKTIAQAIKTIRSTPSSRWTRFERAIAEKYSTHAGKNALKGAENRIRFQRGQMERYQEGLRLSGHYIDTIRTILRKYNVPLRLAYLPHVESSFNTQAYSKVGAAGLWQFMRGTGKQYGMKINYIIDERRDPIIATIGAAKLLSSNYRQLGTWPLAITSYNHGVYGMKRAVRQTGSTDISVIIRKYKSRSFRFASSNFYSCFIAASHIAAHYTDYFPKVSLAKPLLYTDFTIPHYINAEEFCHFMNIPQKELRRYNPALRPGVFSKHRQLPKDYVIHLPGKEKLPVLTARYAAIPDSLKTTAPPRPKYYRVNRGDNLYAISSRFGVSVAELAYENNITKINRIRAGQVLRIPERIPVRTSRPKVSEPTTVASATPPTQKKSVAPIKPVPPSEKKKKTPQIAAKSVKKKIEEKSEDTISEAVKEIAQAEAAAQIPPEELPPAETATIEKKTSLPGVKKITTADMPKKEAEIGPKLADSLEEIAFAPAIDEPERDNSTTPHISPQFNVGIYNLETVLAPGGTTAKITVSINETIGHYADWLHIATWRIRKVNNMGRRSNIRVNRALLIPIGHSDALEQFAAARLEYHMAIEEDFYSQYTVTETTPYKLKRGETLWDICNNSENPIPLWLLAKYNQQTDLSTLYPGSKLWIPQVRELTSEEIEMMSNNEHKSAEVPVEPLQLRVRKARLVP